MQDENEIKKLLTEIRDTQIEHLAEYKRVTERSLQLQQQAVSRQEQIGSLYKRVVLIGGAVILFIIALVVYLMTKLRW